MLKSIHLQNYKSARNLEVPLSSLTVLSGFNGSGKSSVLQAIALIRQSINPQTKDLQTLQLRGPMVQLGQGKDILSEGATTDIVSFTVSSENSVVGINAHSSAELDVLPVVLDQASKGRLIQEIGTCWFQYIQADRLVPRTHYERGDSSIESSQFLGTHGEFTPAFLARHGESLNVNEARWANAIRTNSELSPTPSAATPKLNNQIASWLQYLSPGVKFRADHLDSTDLASLRFSYTSTSVGLNSSDRRPVNVGFGLTYSLPVVTALLAAPRNSILMLENPEAHLHPRGQAALGGLLVKCAMDGVQVVVETHSDHVLNGIRIAAKNPSVNPYETIRVCNFTRDPETGDSYIETPRVLPTGELTAWPDGFFDEWEKSLVELLK